MNNVYFIIISGFTLIYVIHSVKEKKFTIKESFWWFFLGVIMLLLSIFPRSIDYFAKKLNITYPPSLLFILCNVFLLFINFRNSKKISDLQLKVIDLSQELAVLKEKVNRK